MSNSRVTLLRRMKAVAEDRAGAVAIREPARQITYSEFAAMVGTYRALLKASDPEGQSPVGLLLDRSAEAYAAMWAAIGEGRAYVPLNPRYPVSRLQKIVEAAGVEYVICHTASEDQAEALGVAPERLLVRGKSAEVAPDDPSIWSAGQNAGAIAYILYTSGSTGQPKGVPISYDNLLAFVENIMVTIPFEPGSVCSQVCELSFDVSVHEIYQALLSGCTLCPARQIDLFNPAQFIFKNAISVWISVPSQVRVILSNPAHQPGMLASIRLSIFNGEPLTTTIARNWQAAIPEAAVWNTYGPTECTVAVTAQLWDDRDDISEIDVVSIGIPLPGCEAAILEEGAVVTVASEPREISGELLLRTPQRFAGYSDPALAQPFVSDASGAIFYKTGDNVLWRNGRLFHLGRLDHQVKIGGHRIELMEVEWQMRRALATDGLAVVSFPRQHPTELVLFVEGGKEVPRLDAETLGLPGYMIPRRCLTVEALPVTQHGKLDRIALQSLLSDNPC